MHFSFSGKPQRKLSLFVLLVLYVYVLFSTNVIAQVNTIHVPLPDLKGSLPQTAEFDIGTRLDSVINVYIRWSGEVRSGVGHGDGLLIPESTIISWPSQIAASIDAGGYLTWSAYEGPYNRRFEDTTLFECFGNATWDSLLDGSAEVRASLAPVIMLGGIMDTAPTGLIDSAELIIEAIVSTPIISDFNKDNLSSNNRIKSQTVFKTMSNRFVIPKELVGRVKFAELYDLRGRLLKQLPIKNEQRVLDIYKLSNGGGCWVVELVKDRLFFPTSYPSAIP